MTAPVVLREELGPKSIECRMNSYTLLFWCQKAMLKPRGHLKFDLTGGGQVKLARRDLAGADDDQIVFAKGE
jgi:hypothetical protein